MTMSGLTFDQTYEVYVGISGTLIVLSYMWIVVILLNIERTRPSPLGSSSSNDINDHNDNDDDNDHYNLDGDGSSSTGIDHSLQFVEEIEMTNSIDSSSIMSGGGGGRLEVERSPTTTTSSSTTTTSPTRYHQHKLRSSTSPVRNGGTTSPTTTTISSPPKNTTAKPRQHRRRNVSWSFVGIQCLSVGVLILLTYLLLVVSNAPIVLSLLGTLCVFGMFLRYQIGDEIFRKHRLDRLLVLLSLFMVIASMLSLIVYSLKTLKQGEIYEGPARIIGYDLSQYNNTKHDPTTRTDIAVSWGKGWGCPLSGGKVCQSKIHGAMCQVHPDPSKVKSKAQYGTEYYTKLGGGDESALEEDLEEEESTIQDLEQENADLQKETEDLQKEVDELKEEKSIDEKEEDSIVDEADEAIYEVEDYDTAAELGMEVQEFDQDEYYEATIIEQKKEALYQQLNATDNVDERADIQAQIDALDSEEDATKADYKEEEEVYAGAEQEYVDFADEDYDAYDSAVDEVDQLEDEKDQTEAEVTATESEVTEESQMVQEEETEIENKKEFEQEEADAENAWITQPTGDDELHTAHPTSAPPAADEATEEEESEVLEQFEEEEYGLGLEDDAWYWDETPATYSDDAYEDDYWDYDWDSVWGDYACEDLFDSDVGLRTFNMDTPAGGDDDWPFVNIYGSCKTCEAYILDYFAEEAFEEVDGLRKQAILYMTFAVAGFMASLMAYIKYRVMPTAENEVELLGYDGGVLA